MDFTKYKTTLITTFSVITLVITIFFSYIFIKGFNSYVHFSVFQNVSFPLSYFFKYEIKKNINHIHSFLHNPSDINFKRMDIYITENNQRQLNSDLPVSGKKYVDGYAFYNDKLNPVKLRYRGDNAIHWMYEKKSWRVKTSRKNLYNGSRRFNVITPKLPSQINNIISYKLAEHLGLYTPKNEPISLYVNNIYQGLYYYIEQIDESFLRNNNLMPGDIYSGDNIGLNNVKLFYPNFTFSLFETPSYWEKMSYNNHYQRTHDYPLKKLISIINNPRIDDVSTLSSLIDIEMFARFSVFLSLTGSLHYGDTHNWRLYYDPWRQKFYPIVWDPVGWHPSWKVTSDISSYQNIVTSKLLELLSSNNQFNAYKYNILHNFFSSNQDEKFLKEAREIIEAIKDELNIDHSISSRLLNNQSKKTAVKRASLYIDRVFDDAEKSLKQNKDIKYFFDKSSIFFQINDNSYIKKVVIDLDKSINRCPKFTYIYNAKIFNKLERKNVPIKCTINNNQISLQQNFNPKIINTKKPLLESPSLSKQLKAYEFRSIFSQHEIKTDLSIDAIDKISFYSANSSKLNATKKSFKIESFIHNESIENSNDRSMQTWSGNKKFSGLNIFHGPVKINPGTNIILAPSATIIFKGRVVSMGTKNKPVRFLPQSDSPWGTIALQGQKASGSIFKHTSFDGGSGYMDKISEYSAMFSVHDVDDLLISFCDFSNSNYVDDMVHLVYSTGTIQNSNFVNSYADAIDIDMSNFLIVSNYFNQSGNDALDLMSSKAYIYKNVFHASEDKGISVGERTVGISIDNKFSSNNIALQVKDDSTFLSKNDKYQNNYLSLSLYKKNWRYSNGGKLYIENIDIHPANNKIQIENNSNIYVKNDESINSASLDHDKLKSLDPMVFINAVEKVYSDNQFLSEAMRNTIQ